MKKLTRRDAIGTIGRAAGSAAVLGTLPLGAALMRGRPLQVGEAVRVTETTGSLQIENGRVRARFTKGETGIRQEYFAHDPQGSWMIIASSFTPPEPRPANAAPLYSGQGDAQAYRILACGVLESLQVDKSSTSAKIVLSGAADETRVRQIVSLDPGQNYFHVKVEVSLPGTPPKIEYLLNAFVFEGGSKPDFTHVPAMKRADDDVIGDRIFNSPAALIQQEELLAALVPDLDLLNAEVVYAKGARPVDGPRGFRVPEDPSKMSFPAILDLDLQSGITEKPVFAFGFADYITEQHVYWRHENHSGAMRRELSSNRLRYGFDLLLRADAARFRGYQAVSRHLWERYGSKYIRQPRPRAMPLAEYAKVCFPAAFEYKGDIAADTKRYADELPYDPEKSGPLPTWLEFELDGQPVGGIRGTPAQWYYDIQYTAWWNNARDAVGMYWWGQHLDDPTLVAKARRMVNLALTAPQNHGIFPSLYRFNEKRWRGCYWKFSADYNTHWKFSDRWQPGAAPKFWDFNSDSYQTAAASLTGAHLLRYRRLCEDDTRIVPYLVRYGDFLLEHMQPDGSVPAWFTPDLQPAPALRFNSEGGVHLWFLVELYGATQDKRYLEAAGRMAGFISRETLPQQRWYDFETFYSCASKPENVFDPRTGQYPQCTASMMWAVHGLSALAKVTGDPAHLQAAEAVADYSIFYQASWQPHFVITAYAFGGFRSQNSDAEWLDMRSSTFAESLAALAELTHRQDLYERAAAAMRSAFAAISHPRHTENGIFRFPRYPVGIEPENIDHEGLPQDPLRSGFDWGEGGALAGAADLLRSLGGVFVDGEHGVAIGVDGVAVKNCKIEGRTIRLDLENQLAALPFPYDQPYQVELRVVGLADGTYELAINGGPVRRATSAELLHLPIQIAPHLV
ncbi:MAG TPA: hypothetical protein VG206_11650 [Terriglobia bacterium]|nr:hypothetical protein [Terriglobia bacterium]